MKEYRPELLDRLLTKKPKDCQAKMKYQEFLKSKLLQDNESIGNLNFHIQRTGEILLRKLKQSCWDFLDLKMSPGRDKVSVLL